MTPSIYLNRTAVFFMLVLLYPLPGRAEAPAVVTPQWTEQYLTDRQSPLLQGSDADHVVSFYYFGRAGDYTLIGLERVRGDNYQQFFSLMVFHNRHLLGYYRHVPSFPARMAANGDVSFPRGVDGRLQVSGQPFNITDIRAEPLCQTSGERRVCVSWTPASSQ